MAAANEVLSAGRESGAKPPRKRSWWWGLVVATELIACVVAVVFGVALLGVDDPSSPWTPLLGYAYLALGPLNVILTWGLAAERRDSEPRWLRPVLKAGKVVTVLVLVPLLLLILVVIAILYSFGHYYGGG